MMTPFFSVVIPAFNRPDELRRALMSCRSQTHEDFEVIVVDDGSSEDITSVVAAFCDPRFSCIRQENAGASAARNRGADAASGSWIAYLDSDDVFFPEKLAVVAARISELEANGATPAAIFHQIEIDRGLSLIWTQPERPMHPEESMAEYLFCSHQHVMTSALVIRADVTRNVRFDEDLRLGEDVDFKIRIELSGHSFVMIDEVLGWYDDTGSHGRLSRLSEGDKIDAWSRSMRREIGEKAYFAYRATMLSMHLARHRPIATLRDFAEGMRRGGVSPKTTLRRMIRAYFPGLYGRLVKLYLLGFGRKKHDV